MKRLVLLYRIYLDKCMFWIVEGSNGGSCKRGGRFHQLHHRSSQLNSVFHLVLYVVRTCFLRPLLAAMLNVLTIFFLISLMTEELEYVFDRIIFFFIKKLTKKKRESLFYKMRSVLGLIIFCKSQWDACFIRCVVFWAQ